MINKINNGVNFTSNILFNKTLDKGFNRARIEARTGHTKESNQFANAINYLLNDGKQDIYSVETRHSGYAPKNEIYLLKNGKVIKESQSHENAGNNVIDIIVDYVEDEYKYNTNKPSIKNSYKEVKNNFNLINKYLENIKEQFSQNNEISEEINNIQERIAYINSIAKETKTTQKYPELYVQKLDEILGNIHYGEML